MKVLVRASKVEFDIDANAANVKLSAGEPTAGWSGNLEFEEGGGAYLKPKIPEIKRSLREVRDRHLGFFSHQGGRLLGGSSLF